MELNIKFPEGIRPVTAQSYEEYEQWRCDIMNAESGMLSGYDCPECRNKGVVYFVRGAEIIGNPCRCMEIRRSLDRIRRSGLQDVLEQYTFDRYEVSEDWQRRAKATAMDYVHNHENGWLLLCGQVGSGKTHLCTAAVGELMRMGMAARYMLWRDESARLKACVNDEEEYRNMISPLKTVDVLYIDDLFKTSPNTSPTQGDINLAFEIINYRYCQPDKLTVISCEKTVDDLLRIDEAVGSRIYQRTKDHQCVIGNNPKRNYRMRGN